MHFDLGNTGFRRFIEAVGQGHLVWEDDSHTQRCLADPAFDHDAFLADPFFRHAETQADGRQYEYTPAEMESHWRCLSLCREKLDELWDTWSNPTHWAYDHYDGWSA